MFFHKKKPRTLILITALSAVLLPIMFLYAKADPEEHAIFPKCLFYSLTGLQCPGCGSQRAIHHLLNGEFAEALRYNALSVIAIPYIVLGAILLCLKEPGSHIIKLRDTLYRGNAVYIVLFIILSFWIIRNFISISFRCFSLL